MSYNGQLLLCSFTGVIVFIISLGKQAAQKHQNSEVMHQPALT